MSSSKLSSFKSGSADCTVSGSADCSKFSELFKFTKSSELSKFPKLSIFGEFGVGVVAWLFPGKPV